MGLVVFVNPGDAGDVVRRLVLLIASAIGLATFGHLLNDWFDVASDRRAGKPNRLAGTSVKVRALTAGVALAAGLAPWAWLTLSTFSVILLVSEVLLFVLYSVPPARLKERGTWGVLADAVYAYVVPFLLAASIFPAATSETALLCALGTWERPSGSGASCFTNSMTSMETVAPACGPRRSPSAATAYTGWSLR